MVKRRKNFKPKFKFQLVVETLQHDGSDSEIARAYDVHPVTLSKWKARFFEQGSEIFSGQQQTKHYEKRIADLERLLGQKEVEIALLKIFWEGADRG